MASRHGNIHTCILAGIWAGISYGVGLLWELDALAYLEMDDIHFNH